MGHRAANWAGGSSQLLISVRQLQANDGLTSASTECSSWQVMFFMTELQAFEPDDRRADSDAAYHNPLHGDG